MSIEGRWWNRRYARGGASGKGSLGAYRKWKWGIINKHVKVENKTVLDVGCGDLNFLKGKRFKDYTGIDAAEFIIEKNRKAKPSWTFILGDVASKNLFLRGPERPNVVLCLDVLFHIMDNERFANLLQNLNRWTGEFLFINTWAKNPLPTVHDGEFQYFRDLNEWLPLSDLELVVQYPHADGFNMMYVFRRILK